MSMMTHTKTALHMAIVACFLMSLTACDADPVFDDGGGASDADALRDAGSPTDDAGAVDGGATSDAGTPDAGVSDGGPPPEPGLFDEDDLTYVGAFRLSSSEFGDSSTNYAVGALGYNPERNSLFIAGHAQHNAIAEFAIPDGFGSGTEVEGLPVVDTPLQDFHRVLDASPSGNPDGMDKITGLYWSGGHLLVQANRWYDAAGSASDTTLLIEDGDLDGTVLGYFQLDGRARSAGFISPVPSEWQERLGGPALAGWAANYSIISRYSVGPSLYVFDPADITSQVDDPGAGGRIEATAHMDFFYGDGVYLAEDALAQQCDITDDVTTCEADAGASPLWNHLSDAMYGFIVPGTRTYAVFGSTGGINTGIGYKIRQDNDNLCGGYCAYGADDYTNYVWLFDLEAILAADSVSAPQPYAYGPWEVPFDDGGGHAIIGGAWDAAGGLLYLALGGAGQVGRFDRPPLIVVYRLAA